MTQPAQEPRFRIHTLHTPLSCGFRVSDDYMEHRCGALTSEAYIDADNDPALDIPACPRHMPKGAQHVEIAPRQTKTWCSTCGTEGPETCAACAAILATPPPEPAPLAAGADGLVLLPCPGCRFGGDPKLLHWPNGDPFVQCTICAWHAPLGTWQRQRHTPPSVLEAGAEALAELAQLRAVVREYIDTLDRAIALDRVGAPHYDQQVATDSHDAAERALRALMD